MQRTERFVPPYSFKYLLVKGSNQRATNPCENVDVVVVARKNALLYRVFSEKLAGAKGMSERWGKIWVPLPCESAYDDKQVLTVKNYVL